MKEINLIIRNSK